METEIFLTMEEAKDALCLDLEQYGIQEDSLEEIADLAGGRWPKRFREVMSAGAPAVNGVIDLVRELIDSPTVTEEVLCGAFSILFWSGVRPMQDSDGQRGVGVTTELENFTCLQCGQCCTDLDYSRSLTPEDIELWKKAGRDDILARVGKDKDGGLLIWVDPETHEIQEPCPFFTLQNGRSSCAIHALKPSVCRDYPATKKHGFMTGCTGIEQMVQKECMK